jgi:hypothetical protein
MEPGNVYSYAGALGTTCEYLTAGTDSCHRSEHRLRVALAKRHLIFVAAGTPVTCVQGFLETNNAPHIAYSAETSLPLRSQTRQPECFQSDRP